MWGASPRVSWGAWWVSHWWGTPRGKNQRWKGEVPSPDGLQRLAEQNPQRNTCPERHLEPRLWHIPNSVPLPSFLTEYQPSRSSNSLAQYMNWNQSKPFFYTRVGAYVSVWAFRPTVKSTEILQEKTCLSGKKEKHTQEESSRSPFLSNAAVRGWQPPYNHEKVSTTE